jgi:hypothetical protein
VRMQEDGNGELWRFLTIISNSVPESEFKQLNECLRGFAEDLEGVFENLRDSSLILIIHRCSCWESTETLQKSANAGILAKYLWKIAVGQYNSDKAIKSSKCREQFNSHHSPYVATTTWSIHFPVTVDQNSRSSHTLIFPILWFFPNWELGMKSHLS